MTGSPVDESRVLRRSLDIGESERLYQSIGAEVVSTLTTLYVMDESEVRLLVKEACDQYVLDDALPDPKAWITAAVSTHVESRYAKRGAAVPAPASAGADASVVMQEGLASLGPHARRALWLRYCEGWEFEDIAADLNLSVKGVQHLIIKSLKKLRSLQRPRAQRKP